MGCVKVLQLESVVVSVRPVSEPGQKASGVPEDFVTLVPLEALPPAQEAPVVKHVCRVWVQGPVVSLSRITGLPWDFHKAVIKGKVVTNGVLPRREFFPVVRESVADKLTDLTEGEAFLGTLQDGHCDQSNIRIRGLHECTFSGFVPNHSPGFGA